MATFRLSETSSVCTGFPLSLAVRSPRGYWESSFASPFVVHAGLNRRISRKRENADHCRLLTVGYARRNSTSIHTTFD